MELELSMITRGKELCVLVPHYLRTAAVNSYHIESDSSILSSHYDDIEYTCK